MDRLESKSTIRTERILDEILRETIIYHINGRDKWYQQWHYKDDDCSNVYHEII